MKQILILISVVTININTICQTASTTASGRVNVIQPLSISSTGGSLNFGDIILTGSAAYYQIAPAQGQQFRIIGHPGRLVSIIFNQIIMSNSVWVSLYGGTVGTMTFLPTVINTQNNPIVSGNFYSLVPNGNVAMLDLLVGGSINVAANQPRGDYVGTFIISVSY